MSWFGKGLGLQGCQKGTGGCWGHLWSLQVRDKTLSGARAAEEQMQEKTPSLFAQQQPNARASSAAAAAFPQRAQWGRGWAQGAVVSRVPCGRSAGPSVPSGCSHPGLPQLRATGALAPALPRLRHSPATSRDCSPATGPSSGTQGQTHRPPRASNALRSLEMLLSEGRLKRLQLFSLER